MASSAVAATAARRAALRSSSKLGRPATQCHHQLRPLSLSLPAWQQLQTHPKGSSGAPALATTTAAARALSLVSVSLAPSFLCRWLPVPASSAPVPASRRRSFASSAASDSPPSLGLTRAAAPLAPQIAFSPSSTQPEEFVGDLLVVGLFSEAVTKDGESMKLTAAGVPCQDLLADLVHEADFKGKPGQSAVVRVAGGKVKRVAIAGLGSRKDAGTAAGFKALGQALAAISKDSKALSAAVVIVGLERSESDPAVAASIAMGVTLGLYEDQRFKSKPKPYTLKEVDILGLGTGKDLQRAIGVAARVSAGVILTKQLVNAPPNVLTPAAMAEVAENIAAAHADVMEVTVLEQAECEAQGMGAYLGVAAASDLPPKFIHLTYKPEGEVRKKLAIIGKGLTFDSGGYNLKAGPGSMIELMKFDMGGAAATLGAAKAIGAIQPDGVEVHFIVAACENMVSGKGMRPGDILTASNGKTIEVNNTDAEGRLTLADALVYTCKLEPDAIVDLATLTGACIVALGGDIGGLFTPSDSMAEQLAAASKAAGEKFWRMPMEEAYAEQLKSPVADFVNTGSRAGGSITASLFLKEFVDEQIPWAHLDIAGPVWNEKKGGATGFAVQTLVQWVHNQTAGAQS